MDDNQDNNLFSSAQVTHFLIFDCCGTGKRKTDENILEWQQLKKHI